jgi:sarcosine oxidase subunit alpha
MIHCYQEIPCNPCTTVCPQDSIHLSGRTGTIMDLPEFAEKCIGCGFCVLICPGLAITLTRRSKQDGLAELVVPHEFDHSFQPGDKVRLRDVEGRISVKELSKLRDTINSIGPPADIGSAPGAGDSGRRHPGAG